MRKFMVGIVVVVALAGCGSSGGEEAKSPTTDAATTTAATPDTTTTTAATTTTTEAIDYGAQYLTLVAASNCALDKMNEALDKLSESATFADVQAAGIPALIQAWSDATVKFYEDLVAASWPEDVQSAIDDLVGEASNQASLTQAWADTTDDASFIAASNALSDAMSQGNAAGVVRAKLGIGSNVNDDTDWCAKAA